MGYARQLDSSRWKRAHPARHTRSARTVRGTPLVPFQVAIGRASGIISSNHRIFPRRGHARVWGGVRLGSNGTRYALTIAAEGEKADIAKPLKGFGSGVFEVALKYRTDAFRTVYALQLGIDAWVLHAFQKKAKTGIKTPKKELELIRERLKRLKMERRQ